MGTTGQQVLVRNLTSTWRFRLFAFLNLPSLLYWRVRVDTLNAHQCTVSIPFRRTTKNPFKSVYFSAQAGAAELSTGALVLYHKEGKGQYSMLVTDMNMTFSKKATTDLTFTCEDGDVVAAAIDQLQNVGDATTCELTSVGKNREGQEVSRLRVLWSLKKKG